MTWPRSACLASTSCQVRMSTLVLDNGKTKISVSRSSQTNILKSPTNAIWPPCGHLITCGHYPTCNIYNISYRMIGFYYQRLIFTLRHRAGLVLAIGTTIVTLSLQSAHQVPGERIVKNDATARTGRKLVLTSMVVVRLVVTLDMAVSGAIEVRNFLWKAMSQILYPSRQTCHVPAGRLSCLATSDAAESIGVWQTR